MNVHLHPHARDRLAERGATEEEVALTVRGGERFAAKFGRTGFRHNFSFDSRWRDRTSSTKQIEAYALPEGEDWLVITVVVKYLGQTKRADP